MSRRIVDVVNFNADGSCVHASRWLDALRGGDRSEMCVWLRSFVELDKRVTLGFVGATVADMVAFNPEAIDLVNGHPDVFEVVLRPFSHDIGLLRSPQGFRLNLDLGERIITATFRRVVRHYLPPEFMLTNEQVMVLAERGVTNVFIKADRFSGDASSRIPDRPYFIRGLFDARLGCIPVLGACTEAYLASLQAWDSGAWNDAIAVAPTQDVASWRDGESWLLLPDGAARERAWLEGESATFQRAFVEETFPAAAFGEARSDMTGWPAYPVHSFSNWVKEFRMFGFLRRVAESEVAIHRQPLVKQVLWLQAINSDVLSAVEKDAPVVSIRSHPSAEESRRHVLHRSSRGQEGEEFLALLERFDESETALRYIRESASPHMMKLRSRLDWLSSQPLAG